MLLADMTIWFSEKAKAEEAQAEEEWTLVSKKKYQHKKNKNGDLKDHTGQL